jgi:hypothetical protein
LRAGFLADFFAAFFELFLLDFFALFLAAIVILPERVGAVNTAETTSMTAHKVRNSHPIANRAAAIFPLETARMPPAGTVTCVMVHPPEWC